MKGKFLKVSSLFITTLTRPATYKYPAANALSSKAMDNHPQQTQARQTANT